MFKTFFWMVLSVIIFVATVMHMHEMGRICLTIVCSVGLYTSINGLIAAILIGRKCK